MAGSGEVLSEVEVRIDWTSERDDAAHGEDVGEGGLEES